MTATQALKASASLSVENRDGRLYLIGSSGYLFIDLFIDLFIWHTGSSIVAWKLLAAACEIWFFNQGSNPGPLHWEHGVLATGSPGITDVPWLDYWDDSWGNAEKELVSMSVLRSLMELVLLASCVTLHMLLHHLVPRFPLKWMGGINRVNLIT